jgi:UDP-N-acetylmuramoylalanine--D-glutamate ligase
MKYVVYGLGISGISAIKFFARNNYEVIATDDNFQAIDNLKTSFEEGVVIDACVNDGGFKLNHSSQNASHFEPPSLKNRVLFLKPDEIDFDENTTIIAAPGIPLYFPKTHKIVEITKKTKAKLICDIEEFYLNNQNQTFIAITGTNGKSTTTALSGFIFKELNLPSEIGGNIGFPCFELTKLPDYKNYKTYIFETSSYQLDLVDKTHFRIAALLNITPDHIDHHGSLQGYIEAKKKIFRNQTAKDYAIINVDNINSKTVFDELKNDSNFTANLIPISTKKINDGGVSVINNILYNRIDYENNQFNLGDIFLKGEHNAENIAMSFAITYCYLKQVPNKISQLQIIDVIKKFKGLRHRLQFIGKIDDINFINDSKATNAESTENALKAYDNIFWILGGRAKEGGISILTPYFSKIKKAYLIGEASEDFAKVLTENSVEFEKCGNLENAVKKSFFDAKKYSLKEKNIILSPACASLDQWKNFEERGDFFCKMFDEIQTNIATTQK